MIDISPEYLREWLDASWSAWEKGDWISTHLNDVPQLFELARQAGEATACPICGDGVLKAGCAHWYQTRKLEQERDAFQAAAATAEARVKELESACAAMRSLLDRILGDSIAGRLPFIGSRVLQNAIVLALSFDAGKGLLAELEKYKQGCQQLEMAHADAMALVLSHEGHIEKLLAELEQAKARTDGLKKLLCNLTIGGSEFVDNPERCAEWVVNTIRSVTELAVKATIARNKQEAENTRLRSALTELVDYGMQLYQPGDALWSALEDARRALEMQP